MTVLVADVGGTNARLGFVINGQVDMDSVKRFSNEKFESFYDIVSAYLSQTDHDPISACVVAMAGPVTNTTAKLTNRNWEITTNELQRVANCPKAMLLNDLASLGYAVTQIPVAGVPAVWPGRPQPPENAQYLVVGIGTGFNVCAVKTNAQGQPTCMRAECGHIPMPNGVLSYLDDEIANHFETIEDLFSGRGFAKLYALISGTDGVDGQEVAQRHADGTDKNASLTLEKYAQMLGALTRELLLMYMPTGGVYFAGSVGRGVFESGMGLSFTDVFHQDHFISCIKDIPIRTITDDGAGLIGCATAGLSLQ